MAHKIYTELQVFLGKEMREAARGRRGRKRRATQQKPDVFHAQIPAVELCQFLKIGNCELGFLLPVGEMRSCQLENDSFSVPIPVPISDNLLKAAEQRWARSRSLILIFKITTGDLDLLGDLDQF